MELYFAPGACSFVPHFALERISQATGQPYEPRIVKIHKGEQFAPDYLKLNPNGQVPTLVVDGKPLTQIIAIADYLNNRFESVGLLPNDPLQKANALSELAWMNNTVHPVFTRVFRTEQFVADEAMQPAVRKQAAEQFGKLLQKIQDKLPKQGFWAGEQPGFHDAYAFTLLRWGGVAGIDPASLPEYKASVERFMQHPAAKTVIERERIGLNTYKPA